MIDCKDCPHDNIDYDHWRLKAKHVVYERELSMCKSCRYTQISNGERHIISLKAENERLRTVMQEAADMIRADTTKEVGDRDPHAIIDWLVHY